MTWIAPAALLGALFVALPIFIHLMGRGRTTVIRFPTLRFLEASRLMPVRRTRLQDIALLLLRAGAIVLAAMALAQPQFRQQPVASPAELGLARAVVLDTSASMNRPAGGAGVTGTVAASAKRVADSLANDAARAVVVRAADLRSALEGAGAWAATQSGRVEIAVVSDFQRGALDSTAVARLGPAVGLQLFRVATADRAAPLTSRTRQSGTDVNAHVTFASDRTDVDWTLRPFSAPASSVQLRAGSAASDLVTATRQGAAVVGVPWWVDSAQGVGALKTAIAVAFPGDRSIDGVRAGTRPLTSRRQADIIVRLLNDPLVETAGDESSFNGAMSTVESGRPVLSIVSRVAVGSAASAALVAAAERAVSTAAPVSELEPGSIADGELANWRRAPGDRPMLTPENPAAPPEFDGRWFWILALLLLGVEALLRRAPQHVKAAGGNGGAVNDVA